MKYICTIDNTDMMEIFTFPETVNHDAMAEALSSIKNQTHGDWHRVMRTPISAGFVDTHNVCYGKSITLDLSSRKEDTELLAQQL